MPFLATATVLSTIVALAVVRPVSLNEPILTEVAPGLVATEEFSLVRFKGDAEKAAKTYDGVPVWGAEAIAAPRGTPPQFGAVKPGMLADLVMVDQNPIANLKVLYGTGWIHVNDDTGAVERIGGIKWVMKDGIVYDAKKLLADVEKIVADAKAAKK